MSGIEKLYSHHVSVMRKLRDLFPRCSSSILDLVFETELSKKEEI